MKNPIFDVSPTGRLIPHGSVTGTLSFGPLLTAKQRKVLDRVVNGSVEVAGLTFTRDQLMSIFTGHLLPRDEAVRKALDIHRTFNMDLGPIEQRITNQLRPNPATPHKNSGS